MSKKLLRQGGILTLICLLFLIALIPISAEQYPLTVEDQFGRFITINSQPERIISGSPGNTEILFALGLEERIVGVTDWCDFPQEALSKSKIGNIAPINIERVVSLRPDLVLACNLNGKEPVEKLTELSLPVVALNPMSLQDIIEAIRLVGLVTGEENEAEKLAKKLEETIQRVAMSGSNRRKEQLKVFIAIGNDLNSLWTAGSGSFLDETVTLLGGVNIAGDLGFTWGQVNLEYILKMDPDIILTELEPEIFFKDSFFRQITAARKKQIYQIDVNIFSRPGPRLIEAVNDLACLMEKEFGD
jgi:iron complex transport system substrate-binding protein